MSIPVERIKEVITELADEDTHAEMILTGMRRGSLERYYGFGKQDGLKKAISLLESVVKEYETSHSGNPPESERDDQRE